MVRLANVNFRCCEEFLIASVGHQVGDFPISHGLHRFRSATGLAAARISATVMLTVGQSAFKGKNWASDFAVLVGL